MAAVAARLSVKPPAKALVVDADQALVELLDEWLGALDIEVVHAGLGNAGAGARYDFAIVDVPFPREGGAQRIAEVVRAHPELPIIALSAAFFPGVLCCGAVARAFGVACALPKPLSREALQDAVRRLLQ